MKYSTVAAVVCFVVPHVSAQGWGPWAPGCLADCASAAAGSGELDDFCRNDGGRLATANQCISSSSCSNDDKNAAYSAISQLCINAGVTVTGTSFPQATYSTLTSNGPLPTWTWSVTKSGYPGPYRPGGPGPHGPWGGPDGPGPFGPGTWGPFSGWSTNSAWRTGPWTAWWGGSACPSSDWAGWTNGPWRTNAPWTSWAGCSGKTSTTVITTTVSGVVSTTTSFGVQVAQVTGSDASTVSAGSGATGSLTPVETGAASRPLQTGVPIAVGAVMGLMGML